MSDETPRNHVEAERRAKFFDDMAAQIRLNKDATFGGAFLLISPDLEEPYQMLMLNQAEPGIFWAAVQTLAQTAVQTIDQAQRGMGGRR